MTAPVPIASGQRLTPARLNPPGWSTYGIQWTATTTNPAIGSGILQGRYRYLDTDTVEVFAIIRPGSTTTFGSGTYRLSLPVDAASGGPDPILYGAGLLGSGLYPLIGWAGTAGGPSSLVTLYRANVTATENVAGWGPTAPVVFASGHTVSFHGIYKVVW